MDLAAIVGVVGLPLILAGLVLASLGGLRLVADAGVPGVLPAPARDDAAWLGRRLDLFLLIGVLAAAAAVRLWGLDARGLMHPEVYIPGLDLPAGLSEPPPRHGFLETLSWHFHSEPHPFGYYLAMWAWTKAFGASVFSIRLPEAILGALSTLLVYRIGVLTYGRRVGLIAAALLGLHGFSVFWSQSARMYAPGAFLGLLSTLLLLEIARRREPSRLLEAGYVLSVVACALTVEFTWPLLAVQMLWAALNESVGRAISRLSVLQALAFILAAPMLSHAVMTGRSDATEAPSLDFLIHYFSFGFAFEHGAYSESWNGLPPVFEPAVLLFSLILMGLGLRRRHEEPTPASLAASDWPWRLGLAAGGACALMLGFMAVSHGRHKAMTLLAVLPWLAILIPLAAAQVRPILRGTWPWLQDLVDERNGLTGLVPMLALLPVIGIFAISFKLSLTAPRAFMVFVPYLLILAAAGVDRLAPRRILMGVTGLGLFVTFAASCLIIAKAPASPRDYRGIGEAIVADGRSDDLIFVRPRHWKYTPLLLYVPHQQLVAENFSSVVAMAPKARVWAPSFGDELTPEMAQALKGYRIVSRVTGLRASAALYVRSGDTP